MLFFDQYKIVDLDYNSFKKEYPNQESYLWDSNKQVCPKEKFFFVKAFKIENNQYVSTIEYCCTYPTDIYTVFDFYQSDLYANHDISYIMSYVEIEKYLELIKTNTIVKLNKKIFSKNKIKKFVLFVDRKTNERLFEIIFSENNEEYLKYIEEKLNQSWEVKLAEDLKEMKSISKVYKKYITGKMEKNEKSDIHELMLNLNYQLNFSEMPLVELITNRAYEQIFGIVENNAENNEEDLLTDKDKSEKFYLFKKDLLVKYLNYFSEYEEKRKEQYNLDDEDLSFDDVLNDITLYRHSPNYISTLLDQSFNVFKQDQKDVNEDFVIVQSALNKY